MKYFKRIRWVVFILLANAYSVCSAQPLKQFQAKGDQEIQNADYYAAALIFKQGTEKYPDNVELKYNYAEACRMYNDYASAATGYKDVITDDVIRNYPLATFWYGMMLKQQGKYDLALKQLEKFKSHYRPKDEYAKRIDIELVSCKWARDHAKDTSDIKIIHLDESVNTVYSEFNPFTNRNSQLLYSSLKGNEGKKSSFLGRLYGADSTVKTFLAFMNKTGGEKHVANGCFNASYNEFYFTLCDNDTKKRCDIYSSAFDKTWSTPVALTAINSESSSNTQPAIVKENKIEFLFFASNRKEGKGGFDIWKAKRLSATKFASPENVSSINTFENEYSPYFDADSNKLFFASEGWNGFGGLDIFSVPMNENGKAIPRNLGNKINSPANDFGYTISADRSKAYFASNRKGSLFIKAETCCNDIWSYNTGEKKEIAKIVRDSSIVIAQENSLINNPSDSLVTDVSMTKVQEKTRIDRVKKEIPQEVVVKMDTTLKQETNTTITSETAIKKIKTLLPVTLYFHNDEPECCNLRDSTALNYVTTYESYWRMLNEYKQNFAKGLAEGRRIEAEEAIFFLFTNKVEKGYYNLIQFSAQLLESLNAGKKISVTIQGYCSPLNYNQYNIKLGYRRIASLKNYFYSYRSGILKPFIDKGSLVLKNESIGEEKAATSVSDSREDTRNSVYNPNAAIERKVEIISIEIE